MASEDGFPADQKPVKAKLSDNFNELSHGFMSGLDELPSAPGSPEYLQPSESKSGLKYDSGKPRLGLVFNGFSKALTEVGKVGTFGAKKYTENGWVSVPNAEARYTDAMYRHLMSEQTGELWDKESELLHAAHAAWNALARLELQLREIDKQLTEGY